MKTLHAASLAALAIVAAAIPVGPAAANHPTDPIQPGDLVNTSAGQCTLNWVFDGTGSNAGKVYFGIAAHCGEPGNTASSPPMSNFGTLVYDDDGFRDFALIEVSSSWVAHVSPAMRGWPQYPTGVTTWTETAIGDLIQHSGHGLGFGVHSVTQQKRVGVLQSDNANTYCSNSPVDWGDSGGPLAHVKTGKALGFVSHLAPECPSWLAGGTIEGAISSATAAGFPIVLRTV